MGPPPAIRCSDLPRATPKPKSLSGAIRALAHGADLTPDYQKGIVSLQSLPGASAVIYLDFQGGYTPAWGGITYARPLLDNAQILEVWQRVSEDYRPFEINVTTDLRAFERALEGRRQRVIITPTDSASPGNGGAAYLGSFNWLGDSPCWVFETEIPKSCAEACAHESGHALGLSHNGQTINGTHREYYYGHGDGETSWAPIMGVPYSANVTQWSKGEYLYANNSEDQLALIASLNNIPFRTRPSVPDVRLLDIYSDGTIGGNGLMNTNGQSVYFQFTTRGGSLRVRAEPYRPGPNLALALALRDAPNTFLATDNPTTNLWSALETNLAPGTYFLEVRAAGRGMGLTNGFTAYGSLGSFSLTGTVANARSFTRFDLAENTPNGTALGALLSGVAGADRLRYTIVSGNPGGAFALSDSGIVTVANSAVLDYETLSENGAHPGQIEFLAEISDLDNPLLTETNVRVVANITNINEAPVIKSFVAPTIPMSNSSTGLVTLCLSNNCRFASVILEHSTNGTFAGQVIASDPEDGTDVTFSIASGDPKNLFRIDPKSGILTVAGDLAASAQNEYDLAIAVLDRDNSAPLTASSTITVSVVLPYRTGSIAYAEYLNIPGAGVSSLTNDSRFPFDPGTARQIVASESSAPAPINSGSVMRGYLLPPVSGGYQFWITATDESELWLSPSTNRDEMVLIAHGSGPFSQPSSPQSLRGGYAYYLEARIKTGASPGYFSVSWESLAAGIERQTIDGKYLAPYAMNYAPHPGGFSSTIRRGAFAGTPVGTVAVADLNASDSHTFSIADGNKEGFFEITPNTGLILVTGEKALALAEQTNYLLTVAVKDDGTPPLTGIAYVDVRIGPTNNILTSIIQEEIWTNLHAGTLLNDLIHETNFPKRPNQLRPLDGFDTGRQGIGLANFGSRIRAYLVPPVTGSYTFYLASDGESELKFGLNTNGVDAATIATVSEATGYREWSRDSSQSSSAINLEAGRKYYLEALHKHSVGTDHLEVAWAGPGLVDANVITAAFLAPVDLEYAPEFADQTVDLRRTAEAGQWVTTVTAIDSPLDRITYRIFSGNLSNTFVINPQSGAITVANPMLLSAATVKTFILVVEAQDSGYEGMYPPKSSRATVWISLIEDPTIARWSGLGPNANWSSASNWAQGKLKEGVTINFVGSLQRTNFNDMLSHASVIQIAAGGFRIEGNPLTLRNGIQSVGSSEWRINTTLDGNQTILSASGTLTLAGVQVKNSAISMNGQILLNGPLSGSGQLLLNGAKIILSGPSSFTGEVSSSGTIVLTNAGSLGASSALTQRGGTLNGTALGNAFVIPAGQALKGSGTVLGSLRVEGAILPDSGTMALVFSNNLALEGKVMLPPLSSMNAPIKVNGELTYGGALVLTNTLGTRTALGDVFSLFSAKRFAGNFSSLTLPPLKRGLRWDFSRLTVDGTVAVVAAEPRITVVTGLGPSPTIRFEMAAGVNYEVESTSSLEPPIVWDPVARRAGQGSIVSVLLPFNESDPARFFRVRVVK